MTDRTPVTWTITDTLGNPLEGRSVYVQLVHGGQGGAVDDETIVDSSHGRADDTGTVTFDLYPNTVIEPTGTCYAFTVDQSRPTIVRYYEIPESADVVNLADLDPVNPTFPPPAIPAAGQGDVGDVPTVVDEGNGKEYRLRPATGGGVSDDSGLTVTASVPLLKSATAVAAWQGTADVLGVSSARKAAISGFVPYVVTEAGGTQDEVTENIEALLGLTLGEAEIARDEAAAASALAASTGGLARRDAAAGLAAGLVVADNATYLKVGNPAGSYDHDHSAFVCDTPISFTGDWDIRAVGRLVRHAGPETFPEWVTQNRDGMVGSLDGCEGFIWVDEDGNLRWFGEHFETGGSIEVDPRLVSDAGDPGNPQIGVWAAVRWTGEAATGIERMWVPTAQDDPDAVTVDGTAWRIVKTLERGAATSIIADLVNPLCIGLSEHESHIAVMQIFDGIDENQLVDLHASDATSADEVTCRLGTKWSANPGAVVVGWTERNPVPAVPLPGYTGNGHGYFIPGARVVASNAGASVSQNRNNYELWVFDNDTDIIPAVEYAAAGAGGTGVRLWVCTVDAALQPVSVFHDFGFIATDSGTNAVAEWGHHVMPRGSYVAMWVADGAATYKSVQAFGRHQSIAGASGSASTLTQPAQGGASSGSTSATNTTGYSVGVAATGQGYRIKVREA